MMYDGIMIYDVMFIYSWIHSWIFDDVGPNRLEFRNVGTHWLPYYWPVLN